MNKRTFLRTLGGAVLGVGLALGFKKPEIKWTENPDWVNAEYDIFPPNMGNCIRAIEGPLNPIPYVYYMLNSKTGEWEKLDKFPTS